MGLKFHKLCARFNDLKMTIKVSLTWHGHTSFAMCSVTYSRQNLVLIEVLLSSVLTVWTCNSDVPSFSFWLYLGSCSDKDYTVFSSSMLNLTVPCISLH